MQGEYRAEGYHNCLSPSWGQCASTPQLQSMCCSKKANQGLSVLTNASAPSCPPSPAIPCVHHLKGLALWEAQFLQEGCDVREVHAEERAASRADFHGLTYYGERKQCLNAHCGLRPSISPASKNLTRIHKTPHQLSCAMMEPVTIGLK